MRREIRPRVVSDAAAAHRAQPGHPGKGALSSACFPASALPASEAERRQQDRRVQHPRAARAQVVISRAIASSSAAPLGAAETSSRRRGRRTCFQCRATASAGGLARFKRHAVRGISLAWRMAEQWEQRPDGEAPRLVVGRSGDPGSVGSLRMGESVRTCHRASLILRAGMPASAWRFVLALVGPASVSGQVSFGLNLRVASSGATRSSGSGRRAPTDASCSSRSARWSAVAASASPRLRG